MSTFQSHQLLLACFYSCLFPLCRPMLDDRSLFSLAGEMFNEILGLVTEFRQIQAQKKVNIFIRKVTNSGELR